MTNDKLSITNHLWFIRVFNVVFFIFTIFKPSFAAFIFFLSVFCLEFLSEHEVEIRSAAAPAGAVEHFVEAIGPVDTHQSHHRQEDAHTYTGRALEVEGIELLDR